MIAGKRNIQTKKASKRQEKYRLSLLLLFVCVFAIAGIIVLTLQTKKAGEKQQVLGYATEMSQGGLLAATNQHRAANGLSHLSLNGSLNSAAQSKANDMVARNYWSHTTPDGEQPWAFISRVGYVYKTAGENLAYGSLTSTAVVAAWMDSPGHRANILNSNFVDVGFGFANSSRYVTFGKQTVVVALYARPMNYSPPQSKPKPTPKPTPKPVPKPTPRPSTTVPTTPKITVPTQPKPSVKTPTNPAQKQKSQPKKTVKKKTTNDKSLKVAETTEKKEDGSQTVTPDDQAKSIQRIEVITGDYSGAAVALVAVLAVAHGGILLFLYSKAWHRRIIKGEEYIRHHPLIDVFVIAVILAAIFLLQTVGRLL